MSRRSNAALESSQVGLYGTVSELSSAEKLTSLVMMVDFLHVEIAES